MYGTTQKQPPLPSLADPADPVFQKEPPCDYVEMIDLQGFCFGTQHLDIETVYGHLPPRYNCSPWRMSRYSRFPEQRRRLQDYYVLALDSAATALDNVQVPPMSTPHVCQQY